jgi:hypothetical protein
MWFCFGHMRVNFWARTLRSVSKFYASAGASWWCESWRRRTDGRGGRSARRISIGSIPWMASLPLETPDVPLLRAAAAYSAACCGHTTLPTPWLCFGYGAAFVFASTVIYFNTVLWNEKHKIQNAFDSAEYFWARIFFSRLLKNIVLWFQAAKRRK